MMTMKKVSLSKRLRVGRLTKPLFLILFLLVVSITLSPGQSRTVTRFLEDHPPSQEFFFYPSTLRMVNIEKNPDFYAVVRDIDKLRILLYDKSSTGFSRQTLRTLSQGVEAEKYQELATFQTSQQQVYLYSLGEGDVPEGVVGLIETDGSLILTDLEGFVNLSALLKLFQGDFNFEDMAGLVNLVSREHHEQQEKEGEENK